MMSRGEVEPKGLRDGAQTLRRTLFESQGCLNKGQVEIKAPII